MTTHQPPLTPDERLALEQKQKYDRLTRNVAIGGLFLCPTIALLPPRKLDLYTFALGLGFYFSADHLCTSTYGHGVVQHFTPRWTTTLNELPTEKAREIKRKNEEEKERAREAMRDARGQGGDTSVFNKLWMGDEKEGWKERRIEEERRALEEGKSYGSLILDQVWEVFNWDKNKDDEGNDGAIESTKDESKKP
jgi:hypothetical protein